MSEAVKQPKQIRAWLVEAMKSGEYATARHLPPESVLSEALGISRTQLRDVLAGLEREGFITRRHGVGTVINRHVLAVTTRMDLETEFMDMIRQTGREPGVELLRAEELPADERTARALGIEVGTTVLMTAKLCTADGKGAIYWEDYMDCGLFREEYDQRDLEEPIFEMLRRRCGVEAYMDLTEVSAVCADEGLARVLNTAVGAPLLLLEEVDYAIDGRAIFCSREYFADGIFHHTILRKKL